MSEQAVITTWMGKDINKMSKSELIEALCELAQIYEQDRKGHLNDLKMMSELVS